MANRNYNPYQEQMGGPGAAAASYGNPWNAAGPVPHGPPGFGAAAYGTPPGTTPHAFVPQQDPRYQARPAGPIQFTRGRGETGDKKPNMRRSKSKDVKKEKKEPPAKKEKVVKAAEIKAFLYAWCGQRKMKPEYDVQQKGIQPEVTFVCHLLVHGIENEETVEANNKKDAQSKAAWNFCDHLVKIGMIKETDLPPRPVAPAIGEEPIQGNKLIKETKESEIDIYNNGGWVLSNARQRLNQFCQREHCSPDFKHYTSGQEHARTFICELTLQVYSVQKEYSCYERGTNKKQATAMCALSMVRKLFSEQLIERFGEAIKALEPERNFSEFAAPIPIMTAEVKSKKPTQGELKAKIKSESAPNLKRKAKIECEDGDHIDEHGNWTLENSRQRLFQLCQSHNVTVDYAYAEEVLGTLKSYTASLELVIADQIITAMAKATTKKQAAQRCAHDALSQLYKLNLVEPNLPRSRNKSARKSGVVGVHQLPLSEGGNGNAASKHMEIPGPKIHQFSQPSTRTTAIIDQYVSKKHREIYPRDDELISMHEATRRTELALKLTAEDMKTETTENSQDGAVLQGVVRVGTLAKGLVLRNDLNVDIVLVCVNVPTKVLFRNVSRILKKKLTETNSSFKLVQDAGRAALVLHFTEDKVKKESTGRSTRGTKKPEPKEEKKESDEKNGEGEGGEEQEPEKKKITCDVNITIHLTSTETRKLQEENKLPSDALDTTGCLNALAELRHAKWFQACASVIPNCIIVLRVLRDLTRRVKEWRALDDWTLELLTARLFKSSLTPTPTLGSSLQRVFECIGAGIFLADGPGICDPCEKIPVDTSQHMSQQEREDLTAAAQEALRQFVFRRPYQVLGLEEFVPKAPVKPETAMDTKE